MCIKNKITQCTIVCTCMYKYGGFAVWTIAFSSVYLTSRCLHTNLASLIHQTVWDPAPSVKIGINNATIQKKISNETLLLIHLKHLYRLNKFITKALGTYIKAHSIQVHLSELHLCAFQQPLCIFVGKAHLTCAYEKMRTDVSFQQIALRWQIT